LCEFLGSELYADGTDRQPGSLSIFVGDGKWKACLNDRDQDLMCFVTSDDLLKLLDAVERALHKEDADWRAQRKQLTRRK